MQQKYCSGIQKTPKSHRSLLEPLKEPFKEPFKGTSQTLSPKPFKEPFKGTTQEPRVVPHSGIEGCRGCGQGFRGSGIQASGIQGLGFRAQRFQDVGLGLEFRGLRFRNQGFRVQGVGLVFGLSYDSERSKTREQSGYHLKQIMKRLYCSFLLLQFLII